MAVLATEHIAASPDRVWDIITDLDNLASNISAITDVTIHENPSDTFVGAKWTETRKMFGKEASETMWVTDAVENSWYETKAESHGAIYLSKWSIAPSNGGTSVELTFDTTPTSLPAKLMSKFAFMFNGAVRKAFESDLADVKRLAESAS
jgi:uncharacterized protein YndB with AHSA1/START domain